MSVCKDSNGPSSAVVKLDNLESAERAVSDLDGEWLRGMQIKVCLPHELAASIPKKAPVRERVGGLLGNSRHDQAASIHEKAQTTERDGGLLGDSRHPHASERIFGSGGRNTAPSTTLGEHAASIPKKAQTPERVGGLLGINRHSPAPEHTFSLRSRSTTPQLTSSGLEEARAFAK